MELTLDVLLALKDIGIKNHKNVNLVSETVKHVLAHKFGTVYSVNKVNLQRPIKSLTIYRIIRAKSIDALICAQLSGLDLFLMKTLIAFGVLTNVSGLIGLMRVTFLKENLLVKNAKFKIITLALTVQPLLIALLVNKMLMENLAVLHV